MWYYHYSYCDTPQTLPVFQNLNSLAHAYTSLKTHKVSVIKQLKPRSYKVWKYDYIYHCHHVIYEIPTNTYFILISLTYFTHIQLDPWGLKYNLLEPRFHKF